MLTMSSIAANPFSTEYNMAAFLVGIKINT